MTVEMLIEELQKMPPKTEVFVASRGTHGSPARKVDLSWRFRESPSEGDPFYDNRVPIVVVED